MTVVRVAGGFDNFSARHMRFLFEASRLGIVHATIYSDETIASLTGKPPKFPLPERLYMLQSVRFVSRVSVIEQFQSADEAALLDTVKPDLWAVDEMEDTPLKQHFSQELGLNYHILRQADLAGFPEYDLEVEPPVTGRKKVMVTGCFDWLHSGHVRFFEEASEYGDLYVVVGHDANLRLLKGEGHPLFSQAQRRFMVSGVRFVTRALVSTGHGWMDAEPEVLRLRPDIYLVNEDGDKPEKKAFCTQYGLQYVVLKRLPKEGLPRRQSTKLRGF